MSKKEALNTPLPDLKIVKNMLLSFLQIKEDDIPLERELVKSIVYNPQFINFLGENAPAYSDKQIKKIKAQVFQILTDGSGKHTAVSTYYPEDQRREGRTRSRRAGNRTKFTPSSKRNSS